MNTPCFQTLLHEKNRLDPRAFNSVYWRPICDGLEPSSFIACPTPVAAGNTELLLLSEQTTGQTEHRDLVEKIGRMGLKEYFKTRSPLPSGIMGAPEAPGLMLGKAGTGYFYLRLCQPERVPSILLVTPEP